MRLSSSLIIPPSPLEVWPKLEMRPPVGPEVYRGVLTSILASEGLRDVSTSSSIKGVALRLRNHLTMLIWWTSPLEKWMLKDARGSVFGWMLRKLQEIALFWLSLQKAWRVSVR